MMCLTRFWILERTAHKPSNKDTQFHTQGKERISSDKFYYRIWYKNMYTAFSCELEMLFMTWISLSALGLNALKIELV